MVLTSIRQSVHTIIYHIYNIITYVQVLDVLAQHHLEYVSLAWGALKFIFMVHPPPVPPPRPPPPHARFSSLITSRTNVKLNTPGHPQPRPSRRRIQPSARKH